MRCGQVYLYANYSQNPPGKPHAKKIQTEFGQVVFQLPHCLSDGFILEKKRGPEGGLTKWQTFATKGIWFNEHALLELGHRNGLLSLVVTLCAGVCPAQKGGWSCKHKTAGTNLTRLVHTVYL